MLIVYVAHPIGGDVERNISLVEEKCGQIYRYRPEVIPLAPYLMALKFLDDANPDDRLRGTLMNREFFRRRLIDEVWLFGPRISNGMLEEVGWARKYRIPVVPMNQTLLRELALQEIREGSVIQIRCDGPGGGPTIGRLLEFLPCNSEVRIHNPHWQKKYLLHHKIPWCDLAVLAPYGVPIESPKHTKAC